MPTDQTPPSAPRRTGEQQLFLNRARLVAQQKVTKAKSDRAQVLIDAHVGAAAQLANAQVAAVERLTSTITKYYLQLGVFGAGPPLWAELDAGGTIARMISGPTEDASFDTVNGRIYFSRPVIEAGVWELLSSDLNGGGVKRIGLRDMFNFQTGATALDLAERAVFWIGGDGVIARTSLDGGDPRAATRILKPIDPAAPPGQQYEYPAAIAIDPGRRLIYWGYGGSVGVIDYDGNGNRELHSFGPPDRTGVGALSLDTERGFLYLGDGNFYRMRTDGSELVRIATAAQIWGQAWVDPATQLMLSVVSEGGMVDSPWYLYVGSVGQDLTKDSFVPMWRKQSFAGPLALPPDFRRVVQLIPITTTSEGSAKVASATNQLQDAQATGPVKIAAAHADAQQQRDAAHAELEAAHAEAAAKISDQQRQAAATRAAAQDAARARQAQAAQHVSDAHAQATQTNQDAEAQANAVLAQKQQDANAIKAPAQATLDDARRQQQNS